MVQRSLSPQSEVTVQHNCVYRHPTAGLQASCVQESLSLQSTGGVKQAPPIQVSLVQAFRSSMQTAVNEHCAFTQVSLVHASKSSHLIVSWKHCPFKQ